jgi:hypothetical protein
MSYHLRPGLHFCICSGRAIFLDVPGDRYFCLPSAIDAAFQFWASGQRSDVAEKLSKLIELGVIIEGGPGSPTAPPRLTQTPKSDLSAAVSGNIVWILWASAEQLLARRRLRRSSFSSLVHALEVEPRRQKVSSTNPGILSRVAGAFGGSRLLVHGWDNCLSQSLAFHRVCRRLRIDAELVIGVSVDPFSAHCWVQLGDVVLNDSVERVRNYTPILAA